MTRATAPSGSEICGTVLCNLIGVLCDFLLEVAVLGVRGRLQKFLLIAATLDRTFLSRKLKSIHAGTLCSYSSLELYIYQLAI